MPLSVAQAYSSVDPWYTWYVITTAVQDPRLEMIEDLESMFEVRVTFDTSTGKEIIARNRTETSQSFRRTQQAAACPTYFLP